MEARILGNFGKVAGLGGLALGVFLLVFRDILAQKIIPDFGLYPAQAFAIIVASMVLTFGLAGIGIISWLISRNPSRDVSAPTLIALVVLILIILASAIYIVTNPQLSDQTDKIGEDSIVLNYTVCVGSGGGNICPPGSVVLPCYSSVPDWAKKECDKGFGVVSQTQGVRGGQCGWYTVQVSCKKSR